MENDVFERLRLVLKEKDFSRKKLAEVSGLPLSTVTTNISGVPKQPSYAIIETVLYQFPDISAEWLIRGTGSRYTKDILTGNESEEVQDIKIELSRAIRDINKLEDENLQLRKKLAVAEERIGKLIDILHQEPSPRFSLVAEEEDEYITDNSLTN